MASRTDRGVSAVGNALTLVSRLSGPVLLRALNGISPEMFFVAAAPVAEDFRVRRATMREYRYFEAEPPQHRERWERAAGLFRGTVDVRSIGRGLPLSAPVRREVESVRLEPGPTIVVRAPSFVWGMVRKIVGALREVDRGRLTVDRLGGALAGEVRLTLPMAEAERLVLWSVDYPMAWQHQWTGPNRHQARWWAGARAAVHARKRLLDALSAGNRTGSTDRR